MEFIKNIERERIGRPVGGILLLTYGGTIKYLTNIRYF